MIVMKLNGYKTYIVGGCMILYAVSGAVLNNHDWNTAIAEILVALGIMGLRRGIG